MFPTTTKDAGPVVGARLLKEALGETTIPLVCIGGINARNVGKLRAAGATCVSVCSAVCKGRDPKAAAAAIKKQMACEPAESDVRRKK